MDKSIEIMASLVVMSFILALFILTINAFGGLNYQQAASDLLCIGAKAPCKVSATSGAKGK